MHHRGALTWRFHTGLWKFLRNISTNICSLGKRTNLKLGEVSSLSISYKFTISWFYPLNSFRFIIFFIAWQWKRSIHTYAQNKQTLQFLGWLSNFKSFETHLQSPGLNHSKRSIGNVGIRPIQEYLFLFIGKKTKMVVLKSRWNLHKHGLPLQAAIWLVIYSSPNLTGVTYIHTCISHSLTHSLTHSLARSLTHWVILNGRVTGNLDGKLTSYRYNGLSTVD